METVSTNQLHSKKMLEQQLSEIESRQRHNEARRMKQIRDVGVDLSKIHKSTRDLDHDLSPGCLQSRRGSLPPPDSRHEPSALQEQPRTPRSRRRLSCIAAIAISPAADPDWPSTAFCSGEDKPHQLLPMKSETQEKGRIPYADSKREKQTHTFFNKLSKIGNRGETDCHDINSDPVVAGRESPSNSDKSNINPGSPSVAVGFNQREVRLSVSDISDEELRSIFADAKRSCRRSSEPVLGSCLARGLQDLSVDETSSFLHLRGVESEELRRSIQRNLPSDIVAETDEEEMEVKDAATSARSPDLATLSVSPGIRVRLSSISETDQDDQSHENSPTIDPKKRGACSKNGQDSTLLGGNLRMNNLYERRKSDGDVLTLYNARKSRGRILDLLVSPRAKHSGSSKEKDSTDSRHIQGHDPPEVNDPEEVTTFVFGDKD